MAIKLEEVNTYPLSNYNLVDEDDKIDKYTSAAHRLVHAKLNYVNEGMRNSVEGVLVVHENGIPHVLLFQTGETSFKLPGGHLKPGENEIEGLKRKLTSKLGPISNWQIGSCIAIWWRPSFDDRIYPFYPHDTTEPKECKKLFLVHLPERAEIKVPRNFKLVAVPLYKLFDNSQTYGCVYSKIPQQVSRFHFNFIEQRQEAHKNIG